MQKLQMTTKQIKAWSHTSQKLRLAMSKYTEPDPVDPNRLQKCLEKLKMAIEVSSVPAMTERLDAIARQVGLKSNWSIDIGYLSSDCFYVEVKLAPHGGVKDVIVVHGMSGNTQSCEEMCEVLRKNDFKEFTEHLKGLCQMYQLGGDSKMKTASFNCLHALEMDLNTLFKISGVKFGASQQGGSPLLHITKGFVGYLTPRVGGHLMRLTYFVSPYDLLDVEKKQTKELSLTEPLPKDLGLSVTVGIESASQRKIQTAPTMMVTDNKITNVMPLSNQNSINIPATFVLKLSEPMPMSLILLKQLQNISGVSTQYADPTAATPLNTLICRFTLDPVTFLQNQTKDGRQNKTKNYIVELPDQHHSYIINDGTNPNDLRDMQGALLSKITFTAPNTVVKIISLLRQQAVYNTLIASCVRDKEGEDPAECVLFEVTPYTNQKLTVTFEHPAREGVACVELDLTDQSAVKAKLHSGPGEEAFCSDDYATKVLQKCLSIPITMRAIMKKAEQWLETHESKKSLSLPPAPSSGPSGGSVFDPMSGIHRHSGLGGGGGHGTTFFPSHRPHQSSYSHQLQSHSILSDLTTTMSAILPHGEGFDIHGDKPTKVAQNPMLASLLQHAALAVSTSSLSIPPPSPSPMSSPPLASGPKPHKNPMLMNLLQEQNTLTPVAAIAQPVGSMGRMIRRGKRGRSVSVDKSPKRQQSEEEHDFDDIHAHRPPGLHHRLSEPHKLGSHAMDPPKAVHTGELSALLSEIEAPIIPVAKPKRGRPCRLDSTSSQSSVGPRQSPKTPSTPSVPTTPTFAPPRTMSHSTLSTPEHPSMDELPAGVKSDPLHSRTSMDSDIFSQNSKNMFHEDLLPDPPRSNISPEMNRQSSFRSQYGSLDINEDAAGFDNDDDFGGLPSVSSAIARMGIPTGSDFDDPQRTSTDLPHPVSLSTLTPGPLSTAIQAGLETRTDMKMGAGALDLTVANLAKSMSIPAIHTAQRGRPGPNMQSVTNLSQSLPATRPRVPVSKGKPKNFIESSLAFQSEKPKQSKKRGRKGLKDTGGFSDSDAPKTKKLRRPGRLRKERRLPEYSSESSPEPCQDVAQYSSITMAVNEEEPLKMTFKTIRHKPDRDQKVKAKDPGPAPKIKIRAMTSGDSATPSPNPVARETKEEKPPVKSEHRVEQPEKVETIVKSAKTEPPVIKTEIPKEPKLVKEESLPKPQKDVPTSHRHEEHTNKVMSQELSKGSHDITVVKSEHSSVKQTGITKLSPMTHVPKLKNEHMKKIRPTEGGQKPSPVPKSPIADFFPKLANMPRIPKISKQTSEGKQLPNTKTLTTPKTAGSPSPSNKTLMSSSPKKSAWGKGDPSKVGSTKKLVSTQRFGTVNPSGRKSDGTMRQGKPFSSGNRSPVTVGQGIRKTGPNILSKSLSTPIQSLNSCKASVGAVQATSKMVSSPTTGVTKTMSSQVKPSGTVSPVPKTSAGITSKLPTNPISLSASSKLSSSQATTVTSSIKTSSLATSSSTTTPSSSTSSSSNTKVISSSPVSTVVSSSSSTVHLVSTATTSSTSSSITTTTSSVPTSAPITTSSPITSCATATTLPVSKSVTPPPMDLAPLSKSSPAVTGTKTSSTLSNRPPPLVIPTNVKVPAPSVTSPPTPSSVGTPNSAGPNSAKLATPKSGMRGNRKFSLMGIIDKIKEKNEKVEKTDKVEKVEKTEKVERKGLFSAIGSGTSGNSDENTMDAPEKETKDSDQTEETGTNKSQASKEDNSVASSKADYPTSKETKTVTIPLTKLDSSKTTIPKVSSAGNQLPSRQPSPSMSSKPSALTPNPATASQGSSSVKGRSSPKPLSQSRPPKVSTPPLTGSQKRSNSPTGKNISLKQSKPSPLSSSSSTPTSMSSPVKPRPGASPVQRTRPIILSHSLSTYQSPEKGQQKVTKVQLAMHSDLVSHSTVSGQGSSASSISKGQAGSSQVRVPSPSVKHQTVSSNKPTQDSTRKPSSVTPKTTDTTKPDSKPVAPIPKPLKADQSLLMKTKPNNGKETSSQSQQSSQRPDFKGISDSGSSKMPSAVSKKPESKPTEPRARKDSHGPSKDKDGDYSKSPKAAVARTVSKDSKPTFSSGSQDGKTSIRSEQKLSEPVQKPKVTPPLIKSVSQCDKEKLKADEPRKSDSKNIVPEVKGIDKQEVSEEVTKVSTAKPQGIDFKVPSPAMVPSPKSSVVSPRPLMKPASSPKPVIAYSPKAPSPLPSASGVPSPGSALSPKATTKRSATPIGSQPPPPKKVCALPTPYSPVESDDEFGMIIDMPQSPRSSLQQKPQRSPRPDSRNSNTQTEGGSTSPRSAVAHSPLGQLAQSPLGIGRSPASVKSIGSDSISRSPCRIDDDLMDEALTSCIQTDDV
ncbi:mediator of RNA polymerase II transcription subunit 1-like [Lytechinus pictus]|uniref:mediator of RNA polymerase II transcription subunit 1-like n=1 Tax=Lytechinus pictus TaxID=7653 RepID=UPI0030BA1B47